MANENFDNNEKHRYWANALGVTALCVFLAFAVKSCNDTSVEEYKIRNQPQESPTTK